jgi:hypothetical protein
VTTVGPDTMPARSVVTQTAMTTRKRREGKERTMSEPTKTATRKYRYLHVLQGNYGQGWEDLCQSEDRSEMVADRKSYRENAGEYAYRIIQRRELAN